MFKTSKYGIIPQLTDLAKAMPSLPSLVEVGDIKVTIKIEVKSNKPPGNRLIDANNKGNEQS